MRAVEIMRILRRPLPRKPLYLLPSLFTLSSVFCGFFAITVTAAAEVPADLAHAGVLVLFAMVFDGVDGRVARLTRTQSAFGVQLDSLADVVSFGVAPAFLMYQWGLEDLPWLWGDVVCFLFLAAGACRLARFNVIAMRNDGKPSDSVGLPIPAGAGMLVSLVVTHVRAGGGFAEARPALAAVTLVISYLMVSNVPYPMFKRVRPGNPRALLAMAALVAFSVACTVLLRASFILVSLFGAYVMTGLVATVVRAVRERRVAAVIPEVLSLDAAEDDDDEEAADVDPDAEDLS